MIPGPGARPGGADGDALRSKVVLPVLLGAFGVFGLFWGTFAVLLADLSGALDLSPGPLGVALFVGAAASILAMALLGWTSDRLGRRVFLLVSGGVMGLGIAALASAEGYRALLAALVILYAASGLYDVGINAAAVDLERAAQRRVMAVLHAAFSAGGVAGALSAGVLLSAGLDYRVVYLALLPPLGAVILAVAATRFPPFGGPSGDKEAREAGLYRKLPLILVAAIATLALLSEGEMEHWSGVYLRNTLGLSALLGGSGVAVFYGSMAVGRLGAAFVIGRLGNRRTLLGAGLLTAGGMALALATREPLLVVAGFLVVGLALSAVVPITFSVAGDLVPGHAGAAISVVTTLGYGGFLLGPVIVGGLAEVLGLRIALGIIAVSGLLIFTLSLRLKAF
ncbi:MAG TPA: MFS transporter [Rubrobacteraceae bacterium]|nr:MFS transporter [Rubrobacteraceae bacterium]